MSHGFPDVWNPVLVKDLRAALRGSVFAWVFPFVLFGAVCLAAAALARCESIQDVSAGPAVFGPVYVVMCVALLALVPISAFFSLAGEWEENTHDLLSISDLRPRRIVLGKLGSAGIEAALCFSAFAPILVFAFVLRGLEPGSLFLVLALTLAASLGASSLALALSSLARNRWVRVFCLCALAAGSFGLIVLASNLSEYVLRRGTSLGRGGFEIVIVSAGLILSSIFLGTTIASERLAHPEENHSTGPRVLVTVLFLGFLGAVAWLSSGRRWGNADFAEPAIVGLTGLAFAHVFFQTEREDLPRRAALGVPRSPWLAFLAGPFLPGGGRALVLYALQVALACGIVTCLLPDESKIHLRFSESSSRTWQIERVALFGAMLFVLLAVVSWIPHLHAARASVRWITRAAIPVVLCALILGPALVGFVLGASHVRVVDHVLNPFSLLWSTDPQRFAWAGVVQVAVILAVLLNLGRIVRAMTEVLRASRANRVRAEAAS